MQAKLPRSDVSVVIPAYNCAHTVVEALQSVLCQSTRPLEIIVVNDGSTDNTRAVLEQFSDTITVINQSNGGLASARHAGIAVARGTFVALFDADDVCEPDRISRQVAYMRANPNVVLSSTDFSAFDEKGFLSNSYATTYYGAIARHRNGLRDIFPIHEEIPLNADLDDTARGMTLQTLRGSVYDKLVLGNFIHPPTVMFRRSLLGDVGNFDPDAGSMCDWDWILQVARHGEIGHIAEPLLRYRVSSTQMSSERYRYRRAVDTLLVLERLEQREPATYNMFKAVLDHKKATCCLDAADAVCESDRAAAAAWLWKGTVFQRRFSAAETRLLAKVLRLR